MIKEQELIRKKIQNVLNIFACSETEIRPHFILTGPSGSGKSFVINQMAKQNKLNYFEINAAQLTKEGMSGNSLSKALHPLKTAGNRPTVCFVDEFDKLFISGDSNSSNAHEVTTGVQNEFLKVLESGSTQVFGDYGKYIDVSVKNVLFIFAGAFNGTPEMDVDKLRAFGVKTEFLGRVALIYNLEKLSLASLETVLKNSKLFEDYAKLFPNENREKAHLTIMSAVAKIYENNTLGIRVLNNLINQYFINGGKLDVNEVKTSTFKTKLELEPI